MVRIAHLADTHLGYKQYNLEEREKDIYEAMSEIGDRILEEHADIVIHSGDLFDSPRPTPQAYLSFKEFLRKLDGKARILAVLGDHDRPKSRGAPPHILFEDQIQTLGINGNAECQKLTVNSKEVLVAGLSNLSRTYRAILVDELKKLEALRLEGKLSVLVLHEGIEKFLPYEGASEIRLDEVPKNFDYYAMGHLHSRIRASQGKGELAYPGSSEIIRKDEITSWQKRGKGFYIIDLESGGTHLTEVNLETIRPQIQVDLSYQRLEIELEELVSQIEKLKKLPIVHVRVGGREIDRQSVHEALNEVLAGKTLTFRQETVEEAELRLPELKPGSFYVNKVLMDYFKDKDIAELAAELLKHLRYGDTDEAEKIAEEYFRKVEIP